jgi:DNA-directed RNA polymerase specialized sigma24 family protein
VTNASPSEPKKWSLDRASLDRLLEQLGDDREAAAQRYERIRHRLIKFFAWERCPAPEDHADETLNRTARRIVEGESIVNSENYVFGVARLVRREAMAKLQRSEAALADYARALQRAGPQEDASQSMRVDRCFESCLARLDEDQRAFILRYYQGISRDRIDNRKALARSLGLPLNAVRNRALRLRESLEKCLAACLNRHKIP